MVADPSWYKDAVIYQVHIKSFFDSNDDGVGDFPGLTRKLDYIASLGVNTIWLLPFYPSPRRDDGYDIADYTSLHGEYGTFRDFRRFLTAAHQRELRVVTELVINHTSDKHPWFQRARLAKPGSIHRDFYVWRADDKGYGDTRVIFVDTEKSNWAWDEEAKAYYWHRFYSHQPDLNFESPYVMKALLRVLHFWLRAGVDGLRLDAVPYLCEREGTNNENLPETHAIIRRIRAELDAHYPDKMLLAEANQWPEDVQEYFGQGDECHMAFNFPLMPRMYMAVAQEDRYPITDILRQTPKIPESCQWAIFLRNHDELTLEMVTDQERDYLWNTYAVDRRARINLGIRRRLAPLMDRDRRRIELMTSLLLSMPGTPVIYYGDEIGMGDNIFLGDRDGVRTPMQWAPDRNGGFSRADPARLVLPPLMDAAYGYAAVNVEAQSADPHSLLNWTRRLVGIRQARRTFGRGEIRFLYPGNRKILAYIREQDGESILCVCNLGRTAQSVELSLSSYSGRVPIELLGRTPFPPIGDLPYLITLPPYGFFWFLLATNADVPAWHTPQPVPMTDFVTFVLRADWKLLLEGDQRALLETNVLPTYLPLRRWFAGKGDALRGVPVIAATSLPTADGDALLLEFEAGSGSGNRYLLPISVCWAAAAHLDPSVPQSDPLVAQLALARARRGRRVGLITDATTQDAFVHALLNGFGNRSVLADPHAGDIEFRAEPAFAAIGWTTPPEIQRLGGDQSNTSIIVDARVILKLLRRTHSGIHPEVEMGRHLGRIPGFDAAPAFLGEITRRQPDGTERVLAVALQFARNQGDGWTWLRAQLNRIMVDLLPKAGNESLADRKSMTPSRMFVQTLGRRVAELHRALALPTDDAAFKPEPVTAADTTAWVRAAHDDADTALTLLQDRSGGLPDDLAALIDQALKQRGVVERRLARLSRRVPDAQKTRIHGDLHLGQVLVAAGDALIVDFEGEPARPLEERREKSSPARDVAGMLRSFDYAARSVVQDTAAANVADAEPASILTDQWRSAMSADFLEAYFVTMDTSPVWPAKPEQRLALIDFFLLWKALYELHYELTNRPQWVGLPLRAVLEISGRKGVA